MKFCKRLSQYFMGYLWFSYKSVHYKPYFTYGQWIYIPTFHIYFFLALLNSFRICELRDNKSRESRNFLAKISEILLRRMPCNNVIFRSIEHLGKVYAFRHTPYHTLIVSRFIHITGRLNLFYIIGLFSIKNAKLILFIWKASC